MAQKIVTGKQAQKCIDAILSRTGWTLSRTAKHLKWPRETLAKIHDGRTANPHQKRMDRLAKLLEEVEAMK